MGAAATSASAVSEGRQLLRTLELRFETRRAGMSKPSVLIDVQPVLGERSRQLGLLRPTLAVVGKAVCL